MDDLSRQDRAGWPWKVGAAMYMTSYTLLAIWFLLNTWFGDRLVLRIVGLTRPDESSLSDSLISCSFCFSGALMGCGAFGIISFHKYVAVTRSFATPHVWGYYLAPFLAGTLGIVVYALLRTGLLVFAGNATSGTAHPVSESGHLAYLVAGFLGGFGWFELLMRLRRMVFRVVRDPDRGIAEDQPKGVTEQLRSEARN